MTKRPPKLRKTKRAGKEIGGFFVEVRGQRVWLKTKDPDEAKRRRARAMKGERHFEDDTEGGAAATAISSAFDGTGDAKTPPVVEPPRPAAPSLPATPAPAPGIPSAHTAAAALPPMPGPETPPSAAKPDGYIPPPGAWAESVRGAAADAENAPGPDAEPDVEEPSFTPEDLDEMLDAAAEHVIAAQVWLQAWLASKGWIIPGVKLKAAPVTEMNGAGHAKAKKIWKRCFKKLALKYMPDMGEIPEWISAPVLVAALTLPVQLGEGVEIIKDGAASEETAQDAPAPAAAAA